MDRAQLEEALRWIMKVVDRELDSDHTLRSRGARTLRRIGERAEEALNPTKENDNVPHR